MSTFEYFYAHFPFCDVICHYCDFYTARSKTARHEEFFEALLAETQMAKPSFAPKLRALYLGGGTPSASPSLLLEKFLAVFSPHLSESTEITLEANPNHINPENLRAWKSMGINRISLGIQSLDDACLKKLGRTHSGKEALASLEAARSYFENVSGDLIYGVPDQSKNTPAENALAFADAGATHVSAYHLSLSPSHFLHPKLPEDTFARDQIFEISESLAQRNFEHYEISNFGLSGFFSKNNQNYWSGGAYGALGPSAHGFDGKRKRWKNLADWEGYVERLQSGKSPVEEEESLTDEQRKIEVLFTSLRTATGVNLEKFQREFGYALEVKNGALLQSLEKQGLATLAKGHFVLTFSGRMLADEIVRRLL